MPKRFSQLPNRTEVSPVPSVESVRFVCTYGTDPYTKTINVPGSDILNIPNANLTTHINTSATSSRLGHVKLGTGLQVASDAGMVGVCSNGGLAVRKASTDSVTGVGCVRLASTIDDKSDVSVPTALQVSAAISGVELGIMPDQSPSQGEWQALTLPFSVLRNLPITGITIPTFVTAQTTPLYLAAYSYGSGESKIGVSTNSCTWSAGGSATWEFNTPISISKTASLRLYLIADPADASSTSCLCIPGHVKSYYVPNGSCSIRYSGLWYGNRTPQLNIVSNAGHSSLAATSTDQGHVYLATNETDSRVNAVPTIAQFKALMDRVAALENA